MVDWEKLKHRASQAHSNVKSGISDYRKTTPYYVAPVKTKGIMGKQRPIVIYVGGKPSPVKHKAKHRRAPIGFEERMDNSVFTDFGW
jgi:hypothetical protein